MPAAVACLLAVVAPAGCGGSAASSVETADPVTAFAPEVRLHPDEPALPVGARWFIDHSVLRFAEDEGCDDLKIAVGRSLRAQRSEVADWIYVDDLGTSPVYWRNASGPDCDWRLGEQYHSNDVTRPHHPRGRAPALRPGEGFFLDLADGARAGGDADAVGQVPAYAERRPARIDGEPGLRLTYWLLFGLNAPSLRNPEQRGEPTHEGDWERVEVLVRAHGDDVYEPVALRLFHQVPPGPVAHLRRELPWRSVPRVAGSTGAETHPVLAAARGIHALRAVPAGGCARCLRWRTWSDLRDLRHEAWYGFGGGWGEPGRDDATSGPLGPYRPEDVAR